MSRNDKEFFIIPIFLCFIVVSYKQTTLNTYSHLYPDQARNLADQLNLLNDGNIGQEDTDNARET